MKRTSKSKVLVAVAVAALVAGCGGGKNSTAGSTQAATAPAAPARTQAFDDVQDLDPGRTYTTLAFKPALSFTVPKGEWASEEGDMRQNFAVALQNVPQGVFQAILAVHRVTAVYPPDRGGTTPGDQVPLRGRFVDWLRRHPRLRILADRRTKLLGLVGALLDITGRSQPPKIPRECKETGPNCAPLFYAGLDPVVYASTSRGRFIVLRLPDGGELVVEQYVEPARRFTRGLALLRPLLSTLRLSG